nr:immunoglobulin light chain junction region [Macaca mulatta]MOW27434.1 immunoglobulin light chain junction region [Macaca mulatta]MOW27554.1 immunoglobulin light chain junction region [Macaca mulatta]MOW27968.1 immunoglobulin light chain junction region [Macaca mulatta]MOW28302.1 immunoglobulin light chain junction region [Macaca mulatta]
DYYCQSYDSGLSVHVLF